ncbi:MAG: hypothetical protein COV52_05215 [Gammaproteobacteria bacterium CG11_big_fil_rev_8_21_14_0_20_46_22]|nr:MAG: hypothetical protein COW05_10040 [Gammaproteobacteria bacterium CG12_big_fil_rev_8_21_14_0_65_46_12]PIR11196.1 MAG: hypothetical protein COV52_05215 [Gammaproteobacteria bacterium CG11_big_fil_rev_8_21_14_0_20_46_22]
MAASAQTLNTNPCGKCRAQNLPACQCKKSAGSSNEHEEAQKKTAENIAFLTPEPRPYTAKTEGDHGFNNCTLTIEFKNTLSKEQQLAHANELLNLLGDLLESLDAKNERPPKYDVTNNSNTLKITLYNKTHFTQFMERLNNAGFLLEQTPSSLNSKETEPARNYTFNPSPLATTPKPKGVAD